MKKLLLLLFLLPTLTQAEEFNLVCEGEEKSLMKEFTFTEEKTIVVKVRADYVDVDNISYITKKSIKESYYKFNSIDKDSIVVSFYGKKTGDCRETESSAHISRITGLIETTTMYWDTCKVEEFVQRTTFEGQCKKQDRAF